VGWTFPRQEFEGSRLCTCTVRIGGSVRVFFRRGRIESSMRIQSLHERHTGQEGIMATGEYCSRDIEEWSTFFFVTVELFSVKGSEIVRSI
jgi:hypothetical protein